MFSKSLIAYLLAGSAIVSAFEVEKRQSCANIHVFGARETTVAQGYGTSGVVVNLVLGAHSDATAEAIVYPACGGQASCGGISYANSVIQGVTAVTNAVNSYNSRCPNSKLVLVGYSQGGQIFDDAFCGGGDASEGYTNTAVTFTAAAVNQIKAAIFMGDPRFVRGLPYEVGTCQAQGFAARPAGFSCPNAAKIKSYCDAADPYCCTGNNANTHQGYGTEYGQQALSFINAQLAAGGTSTSTTTPAGGSSTTTTPVSTPTAACGALYSQCGGVGWTGATCCSSGSCKAANSYYSQCL